MITHELKTWPIYFSALWERRKTFEIRFDDRNYQEGHRLHLREFRPASKQYTGREMFFIITYVIRNFRGLTNGWVALGLEPCPPKRIYENRQTTSEPLERAEGEASAT
jgi:hypothetical protein